MASNQKSSLGDNAVPAVPLFSYAQAAKGAAKGSPSSHASIPSSRAASGAITPVTPNKETAVAPALKSEMAPGTSWADDVEIGSKAKGNQQEKDSHSTATTVVDAQQSSSTTSPVILPAHAQPNGVLSPSSPEFGSSSTSTLAREDDASSVPVSSSESTWENKSQGSHAAEKRQPSSDRAPSKGRKNNRGGKRSEKSGELEKDWSQPATPLHEAPIPANNPWKLRAVISKPALVPERSSAPPLESKPAIVKETPVSVVDTAKHDRAKSASIATPLYTGATPSSSDIRKEEDFNQRREPRANAKGSERLEKNANDSPASKITSPPMDQESWPTPDIVAERAHDKPEKAPKAQVEAAPAQAPKGKSAWEKVDFTPTVVFNTPLPGNARRGGRGGARGGRESGGRQASGAPGEKNSTSQSAITNGDNSRRGRQENATRGTSPSRRTTSTEPGAKRDAPSRTLKEVRHGDANVPSESRAQKVSLVEDGSKQTAFFQDNTLQRNGNSARPKTARRTDIPITSGEKAKEGETSVREIDSIPASGRASISTAPTENGDRKYSPTDPAIGARYPPERKSGNYSSFSTRDRPEGGQRGARGGGRGGGRSGAHAYHQNGQALYPNAQVPGAAGYTPRSPTGYQQEPFFGHQPTHSRAFRGQRAASIPVENYRGYPNMYGPNGLPQLNTGFSGQNGIYDYSNMMAMSAAPYGQTPYVDTSTLLAMVAQQMEYYFSVDNLCKDVFLRKHMDSQGFILLNFIAGFNRLKKLTTDLEVIKYVCQHSQNIEHLLGPDGQDRLRVMVGWEKWILPMVDRDSNAQNEGPESLHTPPIPQIPSFPSREQQMRQASVPMSNSSVAPMTAGPVPYQSLNGVAASYNSFGPGPVNDNHNFQSSPTSATNEAAPMVQPPGSYVASPPSSQIGLANGNTEHEADSFSDEEIQSLRIIIRQPAANASAPSAPVRSFSNGSLNGGNVAEEMRIPAIASAAPLNGMTAASDTRGSPAPTDRVASFLYQNGRSTPSRNGSSAEGPTSAPAAIFWLKDKDTPAHELAPDAHSESYFNYRAKALEQRASPHLPACPHDMDVLYQFWSHFLVRNFNSRMYSEFRQLAEDDLYIHNSSIGRDNLIKFFSGALAHSEPVRHVVAKDYVDLVMAESRDSDRFAYKQLRLAWRDGALNMKNRKRIKQFIGPQLEADLDGPGPA